jgi:hypothetical protein
MTLLILDRLITLRIIWHKKLARNSLCQLIHKVTAVFKTEGGERPILSGQKPYKNP